MEKVYFATTNEWKLRQAQRVLGDQFEIEGVSVETQENGTTCEANAHQKLRMARRELGDRTIIADDYAVEIEGVTLGDVCRTEIIEALTRNIDIDMRQAAELPFPGVFANRILEHFNEEELFAVILKLGSEKSAQAKIALVIHQTRGRAISTISKSCDLSLQETMTGDGWFWNRSYKDGHGISCTSEVWLIANSPRARALKELKRSLI